MIAKSLIICCILVFKRSTEGYPLKDHCYVIHDSNLKCYVYAGYDHGDIPSSKITSNINCTGNFLMQVIIGRQSGRPVSLDKPKIRKRSCGKQDCLPNYNFDKLCSYSSKAIEETRTTGGMSGTFGGTSRPPNRKNNDYVIPTAVIVPIGVLFLIGFVGFFIYRKVNQNSAPAGLKKKTSSSDHDEDQSNSIPNEDSVDQKAEEQQDGYTCEYEEGPQTKLLHPQRSQPSQQGDGVGSETDLPGELGQYEETRC